MKWIHLFGGIGSRGRDEMASKRKGRREDEKERGGAVIGGVKQEVCKEK